MDNKQSMKCRNTVLCESILINVTYVISLCPKESTECILNVDPFHDGWDGSCIKHSVYDHRKEELELTVGQFFILDFAFNTIHYLVNS